MQEFAIPETMKAMMLTAYDRLELATVREPGRCCAVSNP